MVRHEPVGGVPVVAGRVVRAGVGVDTGVVVTGPLAPLFAQVREESALLADWAEEPLGMGSVDVDNVRGRLLEALSAIERHVQDMEKALVELLVVAQTDDPWLMGERYRELLSNARAALPAREKEEETNG